MTRLASLLFVLVVAAVPAAAADVVPAKPQGSFGFEHSDWDKEPFEFLAFLIRQHDRGGLEVTVGDAPRDWIRKEHIGLLVLLLDSKEPCASVYPARSSRVRIPGGADSEPAKASTIGQEAAYLIASYRHGLFPMSGTEISCDLKFDREKLRRWWAEARER